MLPFYIAKEFTRKGYRAGFTEVCRFFSPSTRHRRYSFTFPWSDLRARVRWAIQSSHVALESEVSP